MSQHSDFSGAVMGFISSLGLGRLLGFVSFEDITQALILGLFGAVGGYIGKKLVVYLGKQINKFKMVDKVKQKFKQLKSKIK